MTITIDPQYRVGIAQVDREHQRLFEIITEVDQALDNSGQANANTQQQLQQVIGELIDYTRTHFASEEGLMQAAAYPKIEAHKALHADLLRHVDDMRMRVDLGDESAILDLSRFLYDWLTTHIQTEDREFGKFVLAQRASA